MPNGFFLDEASRGYDAYSIVLTGADQYGVPWPVFAEGLDDYTPALYTYLEIPFVAWLGPNATAARLPAAIVGTATVGLVYLAAAASLGPRIGLAAAGLVAIAPWHILPSRTGAEWVLLPATTSLGVWLLLRGARRPALLPLAALALGAGLYTYAFARLLIPALVLGFVVGWRRELRRHLRWAACGGCIFLLFAIPIGWFSTTPAGQARLRAVVPLNRLAPADLPRYVAGNYLSYFDPAFLIWGSEPTHHHRLAGFGPVLPFMAPLVLLGLFEIVRAGDRAHRFWLWWLLVAPAASALHRESPSSALLLGAIPAWQVVAAVGAGSAIDRAGAWRPRFGRAVGVAIVGVGVATAALATRALFIDYPVYAARDWQFGARDVVSFLEARRADYDGVVVSDRLETPHILVLFHGAYDPATYQQAPIHVRQPNVRSRGEIDGYRFGPVDELVRLPGRYLVWTRPDDAPGPLATLAPLYRVDFPDGSPAHVVYEVSR